jgi:hypothetical protein
MPDANARPRALGARQVHLDFHTSECIPGVGSRFDKPAFQRALKLGRLDSITVFAKCHHSWSYYPTSVGMRHPSLERDLLGEWIEACHEVGVRAPIYYTVGWSATDAELHPEWVARNADGSAAMRNLDPAAQPSDPRPAGSWKFLCPSGGYRELILEQTREICSRYDVDGFFYDICCNVVCFCPACRSDMAKAGLDPERDADAREWHVRKWQSFMAAANGVIHARFPDATVFYNGTASQYTPEWHVGETHFELEDLPTTWGGYDKFPVRARYFANTGRPYLAMSGKFHTAWGEFGGFKHPDAIRAEAAAMIAWGARCSFGDQAHPSAAMDLATYRSIGAAYRYVQKIERYGLDGKPCANLGLLLCGQEDHDQGVATMLLETQTDFEVVDPSLGFGRYEAIVLPGGRCLDGRTARQLEEYLAGGGRLLVLGEGALDREGRRFLIDVGARYLGPARHRLDYTVAGKKLAKGLVDSPFLNELAALRAEVTDAEVLAAIREPYFDRTYGRYCSHRNTPCELVEAPHPAAWRHGGVVCLAHPLGAIYRAGGARLHRDLFANALRMVHAAPVLRAPMPSCGRVSLVHQVDRRRYVAHLLYAPPIRRGEALVLEDFVPVRGVTVELRVPEKITAAFTALPKKTARLVRGKGVVSVPGVEVCGHTMVVFRY